MKRLIRNWFRRTWLKWLWLKLTRDVPPGYAIVMCHRWYGWQVIELDDGMDTFHEEYDHELIGAYLYLKNRGIDVNLEQLAAFQRLASAPAPEIDPDDFEGYEPDDVEAWMKAQEHGDSK